MKNLFQFNLSNKFSIIALITLLSFLIATGSYLFYKQQESSIRQEKYNELKAIADLKVNQIENWIHERRADAIVVTHSDFFIAAVQNWLKDRSNVKLKTSIIERLNIVQSEHGYENIFVCTPDGSVQLSAVDSKLTRLDPFTESKLTEAVEKRDIVFTDFYFSQLENKILYDVIAPVVTNENKVIAVVVFRRDPNLFLYPLIQTWPTPSKTAETLILRVEQDSVVFLNELRHQKNTALKFKIPLTQTEVPSVQAALGRTGAFEGIDYRGAEVLSDIRIIPETKWIMVAKVDKSEIYSDLYVTAGVIAGIAFLLIIACGFGFVYIYNARQKDIFKELYKKEKELSQQQERFEVIMESLGEGIITTDLNGKIQYLNKRAEELTGWNLREAKGRMLSEIYRVKNGETGQIENNILQKVLKHGIVKELANHTILITKSGTEIPVMDTGAPIFDTDGSVNGIVIAFQDETEKRTQQKLLRESEERLQEAQSLAKLGHWNLDVQTMTLSWSLETYRIHELDPSVKPDLESAINFYAPEARPIITDAVNRGIKDGTPWDLELPFITAKGKRLWVRAQGKAEFKDGKCVRLFGTFQDITERKELELKLQKSNERFNMLVVQLNDVVWTALPDGSEIVDVNKSFESVYGVTIEQFKANPKLWIEMVHPDDRAIAEASGKDLFEKGKAEAEYRIVRPDGSIVWLLDRKALIYDEHGKPILMGGIAKDITERKLMEKNLRQSEEQFRLISENVADMISVLDLEGKRIYNNPAYKPILGDPELLRGTDSFKEIHPDDREKIKRIFKETVQTGIGQRAEYRFVAKDGTIRFIESQGSVIRDEKGNVSNVVVVSRDVTEKKMLEQQMLRSQRMESIGTLAGGIAHDLNNVLAPIMLAIEILKKKITDEDCRRMLETIETSAKRGSDIVKQVLVFGRGVEGEKVLLQPKHIINEIVKIAQETFPKNIQIRSDVPKNLWVINADPTHMHQVLLNTLINARDAMPSGGNISISAENVSLDENYAKMHIEAKPGDYVLISVADTGTGIPTEIIDRIFEPFFTTKEIGKGTGLGLSTVRSIIKSHGGFINVYSEQNKGTTFKFYIPAKVKDQAVEVREKKQELPLGNGELILVVDDETSIREITKAALETSGYKVVTSCDGTEALSVYAEKGSNIAVVITDMMMPFMDGSATIRALKRMNPAVKIIAASGRAANGDNIIEQDLKVDAFITKPYSTEKLLLTLHEVITKKMR